MNVQLNRERVEKLMRALVAEQKRHFAPPIVVDENAPKEPAIDAVEIDLTTVIALGALLELHLSRFGVDPKLRLRLARTAQAMAGEHSTMLEDA